MYEVVRALMSGAGSLVARSYSTLELNPRASNPAKWDRFEIGSISVMKMETVGGDNLEWWLQCEHFSKWCRKSSEKQNQNFIGFREFNLEDFLFSILQKTLNYGEMICNEYF